MLDVPRELVQHVARLLRAERLAMGTRPGTRALTCFYQAVLVLVWFRKGEDKTTLGASFGVSRATAYRYVAEAVRVLAAQTPTLHDALARVAADGWSHVILDGKLFDTDRVAETTTSVKGETIDAWYSGKHRDFGANIQAVMRPDGLPIWTSDVMPGHLHDLTCAQNLDVTGALTGPPRTCTYRRWPTPATRALARASTPRTSSPPMAAASPSTTAPTTPYFDPCDA
ncbi:transposase family protein [Micromonospora sp. NBC_00389]|uniref:transposase family protein n=1 Tax=Micromonospora sp. NBC_00389 TaxID=2903586 RepID=UPI002E1BAD9F